MTQSDANGFISNNPKQLKVIKEAQDLLIPTSEEIKRAEALSSLVMESVEVCCKKLAIPYSQIRLVGSLAKGTWLKEDYDVDVFILFPPDERANFSSFVQKLGKCLPFELLKQGLRVELLRKHSAHPYIYLFNNETSIDVVPAIDIQSIPSSKREVLTPVDRTPLHTDYIIGKIAENPDLQNEIRVFKKFLKAIGSYGSEVKTQGFSGYLTELLVIHSGSAIEVIRNLASVSPGKMFQISEHGEMLDKPLEKWGECPLFFPDPTDCNRNVASVVSPSTLSNVKLACEAFLHFPSPLFFRIPKTLPVTAHSETDLDFLRFIQIETGLLPEDRIWSQLLRNSKKLKEYLSNLGFPIVSVEPVETLPNHFLLVVFSLSENNSTLVLERTVNAYSRSSFTKFLGILRSPTRYGPRITDFVLESWVRKSRKELSNVLNQLIKSDFFSWSKSVMPKIKRIHAIHSFKELPTRVLSSPEFLYKLEELVTGIKPWMRNLKENAVFE